MDIEKIKKFFSGKYEFIKLLGRGGFAEVHLALDKMLEREVAIKILLPEHASDPEIVKRFIREARLYAKLEHPNLINIYETGIAEGTAFIVMKYVKGENLKSFIKKDVNTRLALAPKVITSLAGALDYIHENGIIHRDIKPANIILEDGGKNIFLADFGIARSVSSQTMTQTGSIIGTPYYISPEQIRSGAVDHRSDIYALGATLYELITGNPVFTAGSSVEILYKHVNSEPDPIGKITPGTPKTIKYIVTRCLEKKPDKRFQRAGDISDILTGKKGVSVTRYPDAASSGRSPGKKKTVFTLAALFLIPLIAFLIYKGTAGRNDPPPDKTGKTIPVTGSTAGDIEEKGNEGPAAGDGTAESDTPVKEMTGNTGGFNTDDSRVQPPLEKTATEPVTDTEPVKEKRPTVSPPPGEKEQASIPAQPGMIRFSSYPPADIYWNGLKLGNTTQIFKKNFPPGHYRFTFKIEGYMSEEKEIVVEPGKEVPAHFRFSPYGYLTITARPFARFFIGGVDSGENPIFEKKFPVGTYKIEAVKKGYQTETRTVEIENMKKINISFSLKKEEEK